MGKVNKKKVPEWVDTVTDTLKRPKTPAFLLKGNDDNPESWYDSRYPILVAAKEWYVERHGKGMVQQKKKKALIRIEIRRLADQPLGIHGYHDLEEGSELSDWANIITEGDIIVFNVLRPASERSKRFAKTSKLTRDKRQKKTSGVENDSLSNLDFKGVDGDGDHVPLVEEWVVKHSSPLSKIDIKIDSLRCHVTVGNMKSKSQDDFVSFFSSEAVANSFVHFVEGMKATHTDMALKLMENAMESKSTTPTIKSVDFLIEIISASDLKPLMRNEKRHTYVVVHYGGQKVHETGVEKQSLNPIWTVKSKSVFLFTLLPEEYFNSDLIFEVRNSQTSFQMLGQLKLSTTELIKSDGERITKKLKNFKSGTDMQGYLAIRCRRASQHDKDFFLAPQKEIMSVRRRQTFYSQPVYNKQNPSLKLERKKQINGLDHYFVRPMDPSGTYTWLTKEQIDELCKKPSENWTEASRGELGELYVEILSCDGLPNLDFGLPGRNKTDAFANVVFEDSIVTTEVIGDSLNPRFMPWTRRAFKFHITHNSSLLYIGVFDHDMNGNKYDPVGRVAIPIHKFTPNTVYNLSYDLYDSSEVFKRKHRGVINIRLSINWKNQRKLFLCSLRDSEQYTINFEDKDNFEYALYTVQGYDDTREYNLRTIYGYVTELLQYQPIIGNMYEQLKTIIFWRGHYDFTFLYCIKMKLPLHSMVMLGFGIVLTEFPQYTASVFFATIAWLMLGLLGQSCQRPSPWHRPPLFRNLLLRLLTGSCRPEAIVALQNKEEDDKFMDLQNARDEKYLKMCDDFSNNVDEDLIELDNMKTKVLYRDVIKNPMKIELFKKQLYPVQRTMADLVYRLRFVGKVLSWDLFHISFWITIASITMSIFAFFFWQIFFLWCKRLVFYVLLGPWNKVIDIFYIRKLEMMTEAEKKARRLARESVNRNRFHVRNIKIQKEKEELYKSAAMKEYLFGKNLLAIPNLSKPERFPCEPKANSSAIPHPNQLEKSFRAAKKKEFVPGQWVPGAFVPVNFGDFMADADGNPQQELNELSPLSDDDGDNYGALE